MNNIEFTLTQPDEELSEHIEAIRIASREGGSDLEVRTIPNGTPGIVFHMTPAGKSAITSITTPSATAKNIPLLFMHGQGSEPSVMHFCSGPYTTIQVALKPHALYTIFGMNASDASKGILSEEMFGAKGLGKALLVQTSNEQRVELLTRFMVERLRVNGRRDLVVEECVQLLNNRPTLDAIKDLRKNIGVSERQLQKRFTRVIGCPPLQYVRIRRVNEALRLMHTGQYNRLSDIAYALDYYDQSHFIRDMRSLTWLKPKALTQSISEFRHDLTGISYTTR